MEWLWCADQAVVCSADPVRQSGGGAATERQPGPRLSPQVTRLSRQSGLGTHCPVLQSTPTPHCNTATLLHCYNIQTIIHLHLKSRTYYLINKSGKCGRLCHGLNHPPMLLGEDWVVAGCECCLCLVREPAVGGIIVRGIHCTPPAPPTTQ